MLKVCSRCDESKPATAEFFYKRNTGSLDGFTGQCKVCINNKNRKWYQDNRERGNELVRLWRASNHERTLKNEKAWREANPEKRRTAERKYKANHPERIAAGNKARREADLEAAHERERAHYARHKERYCARAREARGEKRLEYERKYREANRESMNEYQRRYRLENLGKAREAAREQARRRRQDVGYRVSICMSAGMRKSLKNGKDGYKWETLVGYSRKELLSHLESQFIKGMTWDNYGRHGWHIDHIVPISWFHFESYTDPEFKMCWALKNLQPLWEFDNLSKSNRVVE